jgi:hypothetical protein
MAALTHINRTHLTNLLLPIVVTLIAITLGGEAQAAGPTVYLNAPLANQPTRPASFGPNKGPGMILDDPNYVQGIQWNSWGEAQATGAGQVSLETTRTATSPVTVILGGLEQCGGLSVYSSYSLQLAAGASAPKYWPSGQTGTFPCRVVAGGYFPSGPFTRKGEAAGGCVFQGLEANAQFFAQFPWLGGDDASLTNLTWTPRLPRGSAYTLFCRMQWTAWAQPTVTGKGVLRNGVKQWGAKVQLSQPGWCPKLGVAYTHLMMTLYGSGEEITGQGNISKSAANRLRSSIGRSGSSTHVYQQAEPARAGCVTERE